MNIKHSRMRVMISRFAFSQLAAAAFFLALVGCSANHYSIHHRDDLTKTATVATVVSVDAKQRAILYSGGRFCSEPSPDVFAVLAQAFSGGAEFSKSADPKAIEAAITAAFSSSEQGSTISRSQTVNVLRDKMFRLCERYLNNQITGSELAIQAARDQRDMISIFAIEQLTTMATPKPVVIGASASTSSNGEAAVRLDDARKVAEKSEGDYLAAKSAFDDQNGTDKKCDAIDQAIKDKEELTADQQAIQAPCAERSAKTASALTEFNKRNEQYQDLRKFTGLGAGSTTASVMQAQQVAGGQGGGAQAGGSQAEGQAAVLSAVASIVKDIVNLSFTDGTEVMLFCLKSLSDIESLRKAGGIDDGKATELQNMCIDFLKSTVQAAGAEIDARALANVAQSARSANEAATTFFSVYWPRFQPALTNPALKASMVDAIKKLLPTPEAAKADCFSTAPDQAMVRQCFDALPTRAQRALAQE